jgi:hypothetical protein
VTTYTLPVVGIIVVAGLGSNVAVHVGMDLQRLVAYRPSWLRLEIPVAQVQRLPYAFVEAYLDLVALVALDYGANPSDVPAGPYPGVVAFRRDVVSSFGSDSSSCWRSSIHHLRINIR